MADIEFTDEQTMLLKTAVDFCRNHSPIQNVRATIGQETSIDQAVWHEMAELGWLGVNIPAEYGGLEMGLGSVVPIMESMGRYLMSSPFFATVMASETILACGSEQQKEHWLNRIAGGAIATVALTEEDGNWQLDQINATGESKGNDVTLSGTKCFVLDAPAADVIVVSVNLEGEVKLIAVDGDQLPESALRREVVIDETRRSYRLNLDGITVSGDQVLPITNLAAIERAALLLLGAEMSGGMAGVLHVIVEYLTTRKQFDKYIGSYQSLKHPTVQILLDMEACRSHLYHAATAVNESDEKRAEIALRTLKAQGSAAFAYAGDRAIQFHGGFGFTYECDAQLFLRRALWCQYQSGDEKYQRQLLAPLLLGQTA